MKDWKPCLGAIIGIVILEGFALYLGTDGVALSTAVAALAGLGGFTLKGVLGP